MIMFLVPNYLLTIRCLSLTAMLYNIVFIISCFFIRNDEFCRKRVDHR